MAQYFMLHPENPQIRLIRQTVQLLRQGEICAVPTDSGYALLAHLDDSAAAAKLRRLRGLDERHHLTLLCADLSQLGQMARVDNRQYRLLKAATPGPYTFILEATRDVPRRVSHPSRKTIGLRVPDHPVLHALLAEFGEPVLSTTLIPPGESEPLNDPQEIREQYEHTVAAVLDSGPCPVLPTTVIDLSTGTPEVIRQGQGDLARLGLGA